MLAVMAGWVTSNWHGVSNTFVAFAGLAAILLTRVLSWERPAGRTARLGRAHLVRPAADDVGRAQRNWRHRILSGRLFGLMTGWPWMLVIMALAVSYFYLHYTFASLTAQTTALYSSFLAAALAAGVPPLLAALPLAYLSSLNAGITHYGTGSAPVFFSAGYVRQTEWWRVGFLISLADLGSGWAWESAGGSSSGSGNPRFGGCGIEDRQDGIN
jgi:divalent anion:Na+ symporter, DASS family